MRRSSPNDGVQLSTQVSSAWARTWLCTKSRLRSGVSPAAISQRREAAGRGGELGRVVGDRHRVEVDDAEDGVVVLGGVGAREWLVVDPAAHRPEVVAELHLAGRLDAREHAVPSAGAGYRRVAHGDPVRRVVGSVRLLYHSL